MLLNVNDVWEGNLEAISKSVTPKQLSNQEN